LRGTRAISAEISAMSACEKVKGDRHPVELGRLCVELLEMKVRRPFLLISAAAQACPPQPGFPPQVAWRKG
jgi:hypothetical protein